MGEYAVVNEVTAVESKADSAAQASVVLASFQSRREAEHMLASLGRGFRKQARTGTVDAFVVSRNRDGSLKLTESRVLSAGDLLSTLIHVFLSISVGFMGLFSSAKGAKQVGHAAHERHGHVSSDDRVDAFLAVGGTSGAIAMVCCEDLKTRQLVAKHASEHANATWDGPRSEFLAALDPGSRHDWVRSTLGEPVENR